MTHVIRTLSIAVMLVAGLASTLFAQARSGTRVLVMPFVVQADPPSPTNVAASNWLGEAAAILVTDALQARGIDVVTREERVSAFERLQLPVSMALTRATTIRTAELLGASDVVIGELRVNQRIVVTSRVIRLDLAQQSAPLESQGPSDDIAPVFERSAVQIITSSQWTTSREGTAIPVPPLPAFQNYVKGLIAVAPAAQQRFFEAAYRAAPHDPRVLLALWNVYADQGLHAKALGAARNVTADSPFARRARFCAVQSLIELGRFDEAVKELTALNAERPSPVLWNALGVVQLRRPDGAVDHAEELFTRAVNGARDDPDYLFNLGYAYARAQDAEPALRWLRESVRFDATSGDAHLVMAVVLDARGRHVEAQREMELARLLGTRVTVSGTGAMDKLPARMERLRTDLDAPSPRRLDIALTSPVEQDQRDAAAFHLEAGRRLIKEEKAREAMQELRRAIYLSPYEDEPHLLLGRLYVHAGRLPEAIDEFKVAIWCHESAEARLALASALFDNADRPAARAEVQRALALRPGWAEAEALLARINH